MIAAYAFPSCATGVLIALTATAGCSRSELEQFDTMPAPLPTVATNLPMCRPVDETLVREAQPPVPCTDPPPVSTSVQQVADLGSSLTFASDQCRKSVVGWVDSANVHLAWSVDGSQSFGEPLAVGPGIFPFVIMDGMGAAHAFFAHDLTLAHVVMQSPGVAPVSELLTQAGKPAIAGTEPIVHRTAAARGTDEIAWTWETFSEPMAVWFASTRVSGSFSEPIQISGAPGSDPIPRLCLAGRDRVVIVWRTPAWTPGAEEQVLSAISEDGGASFCVAPLGHEPRRSNIATSSVDVACAPDGRAIAVWDGNGGIRVAALSRAGVWSRGDAISGDASYPFVSGYPHVWIADNRALVTWIGWGQPFGYALVDLSGALAGPPVGAPDLNLDGKPDQFLHACARDDGFVLLTQGHFSEIPVQPNGPAVMTFLDVDGTLAPSEVIAPLKTTGVNVALECQPTGAVALWQDAGTTTLAHWAK
ncbi:MAG TPA: hypothetical protein PK156_36530 [Polyangium sp.]|nr:hypothetical protein [Polyangium sp.]